MVVKVYVSGISGNKEVKKRQQRVLMILDSKNIKYDVIDIAEPGNEADKDFMQSKSTSNGGTVSDPSPRSPLPPQLFNDEEYCGDYDLFDLANEMDTLEQFLKVELPPEETPQDEIKENALNGDVDSRAESKSKENSQERESVEKEGTPLKEGTPVKESATSKEPSPSKDDEEHEGSPVKETSPERQKSVDKEGTPSEKAASPDKDSEVVSVKSSKESSPEKEESVNENGTVSSRDQSEEKEAGGDGESKKDPSEALLQSEQAAAAE